MTNWNGAKRPDPARSRGHARRVRAGGVLLFASFLFAIVGIVQPCCMALAGSSQDNHARGHTDCQVNAAQTDVRSGGVAGQSSGQSGQCPFAFSADVAVTGDFSPLPARADIALQVAVASVPEPVFAVSNPSALLLRYYTPPPRIYLRTQRFLS